ncbi:hypothetical protein FRC07_000010 [Ceratobasidium sp. 392]|nr:hypothetical protein FRC07_000010 [Ceratobasidium sp. 392]
MLSRRTATSECVNSQNTKGFHLSDGAMYTYTSGSEYEDMYATFDFNLVPGTTTDYGNTRLDCKTTMQYGANGFAGGASMGDVGLVAMRYVNPLTGSLSFNKVYFFFANDVQHVLLNDVSSASPAPVFSVLDQRLRNGDVYIGGELAKSGNYTNVESLWHAGTGYVFPSSQRTSVSVDLEKKTGDWATIGASRQPLSTNDMFSAWIVHHSDDLSTPIEYSAFPATWSFQDFRDNSSGRTPYTIENTKVVSAAIDPDCRTLGATFWKIEGGSVFVPQMGLVVSVDKPLVLMLKLNGAGSSSGEVGISDPTHESMEVTVRIAWTSREHQREKRHIGHNYLSSRGRHGRSSLSEVTLAFELPTEGMAGSTVTRGFSRSQ